MKYNKKSQLFILSGLLLIIVLIFSYSLETDNTYIVKTSRYNLLENVIYETCQVGNISNGPDIESRYTSLKINVENYCDSINIVCILTINNNTILPSNTSLINSSMFDYNINYQNNGFTYQTNFTC